jgi:excisionase family DNA binding protein
VISDPHSLPLLLTVAEAADLSRVTKRAFYMRIARGTVPGVVRIGKSVRIRSDALLRARKGAR